MTRFVPYSQLRERAISSVTPLLRAHRYQRLIRMCMIFRRHAHLESQSLDAALAASIAARGARLAGQFARARRLIRLALPEMGEKALHEFVLIEMDVASAYERQGRVGLARAAYRRASSLAGRGDPALVELIRHRSDSLAGAGHAQHKVR
jgi:hypothetical protein